MDFKSKLIHSSFSHTLLAVMYSKSTLIHSSFLHTLVAVMVFKLTLILFSYKDQINNACCMILSKLCVSVK